MSQYDDVMLIEDGEAEPLDYYAAIQRQINAGCWSLQGSHGRTMMDAITAGKCLCGTSAARDYWGNKIPSRDEVEAGTKGSYKFVVKQSGAKWAKAMQKA